ncbi:MAG: chemoreceptor glutamine deamidase CheD [Pseudomonadota bacterium]
MTAALKEDSRVYFDPKLGMTLHTVMPGEHKVLAGTGGAVMTLLGSCVAACLRDPRGRVGGLNHFLLPHDKQSSSQANARYGVHAMELLMNDILRTGSLRSDLEAKVFGGGNVMRSSAKSTVGDRNAAFVREFLRNEGIRLVAEDLGGCHARRVIYVPATGKAHVQHTSPGLERQIYAADEALERTLPRQTRASVELF